MSTVGDLKLEIQKTTGIAPTEQKLFHMGSDVLEEDRKLHTYIHIHHGSTIFLIHVFHFTVEDKTTLPGKTYSIEVPSPLVRAPIIINTLLLLAHDKEVLEAKRGFFNNVCSC